MAGTAGLLLAIGALPLPPGLFGSAVFAGSAAAAELGRVPPNRVPFSSDALENLRSGRVRPDRDESRGETPDPAPKSSAPYPAFNGGQQVIRPVSPGESLRALRERNDIGSHTDDGGGSLSPYSSGTSQPDIGRGAEEVRSRSRSNDNRNSKDDWPGNLGLDKPVNLDLQKEDWGAYLSDTPTPDDAMSPMSTGGETYGYGSAGESDGSVKPTSTGGGIVKPQQQPPTDKPQEPRAPRADPQGSSSGGGTPNTGDASKVLLRPGAYIRQEVLAVDLTPEGIARVRALGFSAGDTLSMEAGGPAITSLTAPMDTLAALARLRKAFPGGSFHPNRIYRLYRPSTRDDSGEGERMDGSGRGKCLDDRCYARNAIGWNESLARCTRGVRIGIIDTEADLRHPAFAGRSITQKSFLPAGALPSPSWHGTGILALLAGRTDSATPGLIPEASFFTASIFYAGDNGEAITSTVMLLRALDWMRVTGTKLVNMSFSGPPDDLLRTRIADMSREGFVFVAAAGNDGPAADPSYPAAYPQVIAITAVTNKLQVYPSANRGTYIDLAAPGVRIWTAAPGERQGYRSGTSFAAPFAIAVLALQRPETLRAPKERLLDQVRTVGLGPATGRNAVYGRGLLQAPRECPNAADAITSFTAPLSAPPEQR